jgi:hypothetical protein
MTTGGEMVEDYGHVGLTLSGHPVAFLREDLRPRRIVTCADLMDALRQSIGKAVPAAGETDQEDAQGVTRPEGNVDAYSGQEGRQRNDREEACI